MVLETVLTGLESQQVRRIAQKKNLAGNDPLVTGSQPSSSLSSCRRQLNIGVTWQVLETVLTGLGDEQVHKLSLA
jgi:hypothetical protein